MTGEAIVPAIILRRLGILPGSSRVIASWLLGVHLLSCSISTAHAQSLAEVEQLAAKGRYAEALPAVKEITGLPARMLQYDIEIATGQIEQAAATLVASKQQSPDALDVVRREATQLVNAARWNSASKVIQGSAHAERDPVLRWLAFTCVLHEAEWQLPQRTLRWFTTQDVTTWKHDVPALLAIARGMTEHARWSRESRWFDVAVNDVLGRAAEWHPHDARIPSLRAELFAAKHNEPAAVDAIQLALAANASAADVHYLRAQLALAKFDLAAVRRSREQMAAILGTDVRIALLDAAVALAELRPEQAAEILIATWEQHPEHPEVLGGLLAIQQVAQGTLTAPQLQTLAQLPASVAKQGKGAVHIYLAQGAACEYMRHIRFAEQAYRRTFELAPELPGVRAQWVQQLLRLNENERVPELLPIALAEDPFDVRLKNTMAVWEVLQNYALLETEHFMIRFDRAHDELLAKYMAQYLEEEVYPALVERFGYAPHTKSIFEIYNRARNTSGHGWFSARMVGLPGLHTVGACSGNLVAIVSPTAMPQPFHWARVVKHEFVHRMNMEQTNYFVPHWITEGLAVDAEGHSPPDEWMRLITQRYKEQKLFTLDDINFGFIRPSSSDDRTLAYAQAEQYIRFLRERYGADCLKQLLEQIAQQRSPMEALERATGAKTSEIEQGYREFLITQLNNWNLLHVVHSTQVEQLRAAVAKAPQDASVQGELALAYWHQGEVVEAKRAALAALKLSPQIQSATLVLVKLALRDKDVTSAQQLALQGLNLQHPHADLLMLCIELKLKAQQWTTAEKLLLLGRKHYPALAMWDAGLRQVYVATHNEQPLRAVLEREAAQLDDDARIPLQLATLASQEKDWGNTEQWAHAALRIDVKLPRAHALLATALFERRAYATALQEFAAAGDKALLPTERLAYAKTLIATGNAAQAKPLVEQLIRTAPDLPGLVDLARELEP